MASSLNFSTGTIKNGFSDLAAATSRIQKDMSERFALNRDSEIARKQLALSNSIAKEQLNWKREDRADKKAKERALIDFGKSSTKEAAIGANLGDLPDKLVSDYEVRARNLLASRSLSGEQGDLLREQTDGLGPTITRSATPDYSKKSATQILTEVEPDYVKRMEMLGYGKNGSKATALFSDTSIVSREDETSRLMSEALKRGVPLAKAVPAITALTSQYTSDEGTKKTLDAAAIKQYEYDKDADKARRAMYKIDSKSSGSSKGAGTKIPKSILGYSPLSAPRYESNSILPEFIISSQASNANEFVTQLKLSYLSGKPLASGSNINLSLLPEHEVIKLLQGATLAGNRGSEFYTDKAYDFIESSYQGLLDKATKRSGSTPDRFVTKAPTTVSLDAVKNARTADWRSKVSKLLSTRELVAPELVLPDEPPKEGRNPRGKTSRVEAGVQSVGKVKSLEEYTSSQVNPNTSALRVPQNGWVQSVEGSTRTSHRNPYERRLSRISADGTSPYSTTTSKAELDSTSIYSKEGLEDGTQATPTAVGKEDPRRALKEILGSVGNSYKPPSGLLLSMEGSVGAELDVANERLKDTQDKVQARKLYSGLTSENPILDPEISVQASDVIKNNKRFEQLYRKGPKAFSRFNEGAYTGLEDSPLGTVSPVLDTLGVLSLLKGVKFGSDVVKSLGTIPMQNTDVKIREVNSLINSSKGLRGINPESPPARMDLRKLLDWQRANLQRSPPPKPGPVLSPSETSTTLREWRKANDID